LFLFIWFATSFLLLIPAPSFGTFQNVPAKATVANQAVAFVHVQVVPMDSERILKDQTVIVRDGRIAEIGPASKLRAPKGALQIDGQNKYLMPGLIDMHVHSFSDDSDLLLYIANGVTTVRNMAGSARHLKLREQIASGEILGPALYTCGAYLMGFKDAEAARRVVGEHSKAGYDCVKIYNIFDWTQEAYDAALDAAKTNQIPAVGHLPRNLPVETTLKAERQTVEHAEEFLYPYFFKLDKKLDESKIAYVARLTKEAGIAVTPTLVVYGYIGLIAADDTFKELVKRPELRYINKKTLDVWVSEQNQYRKNFKPAAAPVMRRNWEFLKKLTKGFRDAGVRLLLGTDAAEGQPFIIPGFSIHEELRALVDAGLTPFEVLQAGTVNAAAVLAGAQEFGSIAVGKRADLILVEGNPLQDVNQVARRVGVMVKGKWLPAAELQSRLDALAVALAKH
jgi:imidazolonepropionase-like amidohydrolase